MQHSAIDIGVETNKRDYDLYLLFFQNNFSGRTFVKTLLNDYLFLRFTQNWS